MTVNNGEQPLGCKWRSSRGFILSCVTLALFSENFLYSFIVPILKIMLEDRLHINASKTQVTTSALLSSHALVCFIAGPITGHLADKISSRKGPLLVSLGGEIAGTVIVAAATSLPVLFFGRIVQAIAGNAAWVIGFATVADLVGPDDTARTVSTVSVFFMSGLLVGPMVSGTLLPLIGYWPTWFTAIAILAIDMVLRFIMVESPKADTKGKKAQPTNGPIKGNALAEEDPERLGSGMVPAEETSPLLSPSSTVHHERSYSAQQRRDDLSSKPSETSPRNFYKAILSHPRALTGMACHATSALILVSFDATLPLHVMRDFGWNTSQTSLMFLILQLPTLFLSPFTGRLKDRIGTKTPTGVGLLAIALFVWLLGMPGKDGLSFAGSGERGQAIYMASMFGLGIARTLPAGSGVIEMTNVVKELQETRPDLFGPNSGFSRAYSLTNMSWTFSMLIGPILLGSLFQTVGYYYMNLSLAIICSTSGILALFYLGAK